MTTYDNSAQNYDDVQSSSGSVVDRLFIRSVNGILKASELLADAIVFICACVWTDFARKYGGGWVQFVSITALILTAIIYTLYVFQIQQKLAKILPAKAPWDLCETVYSGAYTACYFVSGIVAAVYGDKHSSIAASAFFCFAAMVAYGIDAAMCFMRYRNATPIPASTPSGGGGGGATQSTPPSAPGGGPQY